jgi:hypothetical protein
VNGYLLDTNVPSEFSRDRPEPRVVQWLKAQPVTMLFLSAVTIGEIRKGLIVRPTPASAHRQGKVGLALGNVKCIGGGNFVRVAAAVMINVSGSRNRRFQCVFITQTVEPATGVNLVFVNRFDNLAGKKFRLQIPIHLANRRNSPSCCLDVF